MIKLIKNELSKIFHKKFIYIILGVAALFITLTNVIYNYFDDIFTFTDDFQIEYLIEENKKIDLSKPENVSWYASNQATIDIYNLKEHYGKDSWQSYIIENKLYDIKYNIIVLEKTSNSLDSELKKYQTEYDNFIKRLDSGNWEDFIREDVKSYQGQLLNEEEALKEAKGSIETKEITKSINIIKLNIEILNIRLDKNIPYGDSYLDTAINSYYNNNVAIYDIDVDRLKDEQKSEYQNLIKEINVSKYIIDNKENINNSKSMNGIYKNFFEEYTFLIIIIVIVISGSIVSEEFNKGTIKLLLIRPFNRTKILLSKYLTTIIITIFSIIVLFIIQSIIGGLFFGTDSLSIPVVNYNFNTNSLVIMNIFKYVGLIFLTKLPIYLLIGLFAFALGTIFGSGALAISITFVCYIGSNILNILATSYNVSFMKYFITLNWDFGQHLFGRIPDFKYINLSFSIITCLVYFIVIFTTCFIVFKKKNIKNI